MTFWQENYGFVKEVYDFRMAKYQEWMDDLEKIVNKVLAPNIQYTYKEFKNIQDTLGSLCRDLEKEGMKEWLDMMLEKVSMRVSDEGGTTARDKQFKETEKKRLQALISRHDGLMPRTIETQEKVEIFAKCYSFSDDVGQVMKILEEMLHLSTKEIHPHNQKMVEEQIEKAEKVISTIENQSETFEDYMKRGQKLLKTPNCAPFLAPLMDKFEEVWKMSNIKSKDRHEMLSTVIKDWESYNEFRAGIGDPCERLETEFKKLRRYYDPNIGQKKLMQRRLLLEECRGKADTMYTNIKKCYETIVVMAGSEKKEFLDREIKEVEEKRLIIGKFEAKLIELEEYNNKLMAAFNKFKLLNDWAKPAAEKLKDVCSSTTLSPEDRVNEIVGLQHQAKERTPQLNPLEFELNDLIPVDERELSDTARILISEFHEMKLFIESLSEDIDKEAGAISQDQKFFAEYVCSVREVEPFLQESQKEVKAKLSRPETLEDALSLLSSCEEFDKVCIHNREKLDTAAKARKAMEKKSTAENLCEPLTQMWATVKHQSEDRIARMKTLVSTWQDLQRTTEVLAEKMAEVPKQKEPNIEDLEKVFNNMKGLFTKKKELLASV